MEHTDWQLKKNLVSCTSYMLKEEINTDVSFSVGKDGTLMKAHKLILAMRSPIFEKMFFGAFPEAQNPIPIPDVEPAAFRNFLTYVYSDKADVLLEDSFTTMYVAKKYLVLDLEDAARKCLIENLCKDNLWEAYTYCLQWDDGDLQAACKTYLLGNAENVRDVLNSEYFLEVPKSVVLEVLTLHCPTKRWTYNGIGWRWEGGQIPTEESELLCRMSNGKRILYVSDVELFKVCNNWASVECLRQKILPTGTNKRKMLGDCLHYIQFPLMLPSDIANMVSPSNILSKEEITSLYMHLLPSTQSYPNFKPGTESLLLWIHGSPPSGHHTSIGDWCTSRVSIKCTFRLLLSKIWVTGSGGPKCYIPKVLKVTVLDKGTGTTWSKQVATKLQDNYFDDDSYPLGYVSFEPMVLKENVEYIVQVQHERCRGNINEGVQARDPEEILPHSITDLTDLSVIVDASRNNCINAISVSFV